ncbi:DUF4435 domain-containing protein [Paraburkholderia sp. J8-2]|uniref:DUF4435 domain-containing protein n=1 Tax=Paraburkholderia sp. J8-2 TaxID=2805440 RepID=UPI002AB723C6|nr:DUF4435 domain-containing protein [Paraburkholderia sp. J8-2]
MDRAEKMRVERKLPHTQRTRYLGLRSRVDINKYIFIFEGPEDIPVYRTWINKISTDISYEPLEVRGKENVIALREYIRSSSDNSGDKALFFVDMDYDDIDLTQYRDWADTYVTPSYSIENILVSAEILELLLIEDFALIGDRQILRAPIIDFFKKSMQEFCESMLRVNGYLRWIRRRGIDSEGFPHDAKALISVTLSGVRQIYRDDLSDVAATLKLSDIPSEEDLAEHLKWFRDKGIAIFGRGKFIIDFFKRFISEIFEDSRAENRVFFLKKLAPGDPQHDLMRKLAGFSNCPSCLRAFLGKHFTFVSAQSAVVAMA